MRERVTDLLDALGLVLLAAGLGALAYQWIGLVALSVSGVVVLVGSTVSSYLGRSS